jgi:hypothetical protein
MKPLAFKSVVLVTPHGHRTEYCLSATPDASIADLKAAAGNADEVWLRRGAAENLNQAWLPSLDSRLNPQDGDLLNQLADAERELTIVGKGAEGQLLFDSARKVELKRLLHPGVSEDTHTPDNGTVCGAMCSRDNPQRCMLAIFLGCMGLLLLTTLSFIVVGFVFIGWRPGDIGDLADMRVEPDSLPSLIYYTPVRQEDEDFDGTCLRLVTPASSGVSLTSECPAWNFYWLSVAGICYVVWVPCALVLAAFFGNSGDCGSCNGDGAEFMFIVLVALMAFVPIWGVCGGVLTTIVLPTDPNCAAEAWMGAYVGITHCILLTLLAGAYASPLADDDRNSQHKQNARVYGGSGVLVGLTLTVTAVFFARGAIESAGATKRNTCLACGETCGLSNPLSWYLPSNYGAWADLDELNRNLHDCHLVHCWDATLTDLGGYATFRYPSGLVAPPPPPPGQPGSDGGGSFFSTIISPYKHYLLVYAVVLGGALLCMVACCLLCRRDVPLRSKPRAILQAASQKASTLSDWRPSGPTNAKPTAVRNLSTPTTLEMGESPTARLNRPGAQPPPPVVIAEWL